MPISDATFKRLIMETRTPQDSSAVSKPYTTFLPFDMTTEFPLPVRLALGVCDYSLSQARINVCFA